MSSVLLISVVFPLHEPAAVRSILDEQRRDLEGCFDKVLPLITGRDQLDDLTIDGETLAIIAPLTGGTEHIIEKISDRGFLLLAPHPMMNSLPAALEVFSALRGFGKAGLTPLQVTLLADKLRDYGFSKGIIRTTDFVEKFIEPLQRKQSSL